MRCAFYFCFAFFCCGFKLQVGFIDLSLTVGYLPPEIAFHYAAPPYGFYLFLAVTFSEGLCH